MSNEKSKATKVVTANETFREINDRTQKQPEILKKFGNVVLFDITKDGQLHQSWTIDGKQGQVYEGKPKDGVNAQVTITIDDNDFVQLALGKANAAALFSKGKLKVKGNVLLAQKLSVIFQEKSKL